MPESEVPEMQDPGIEGSKGEYDLPPLGEMIHAEIATEASANHPEENHDSILEAEAMYGVFDGLGSTPNPGESSQLAMAKAREYVARFEPQSVLDADYLMRRTLIQLGEDVRLDAMGKTTTAMALPWSLEGKVYVTVGRCGDSRVMKLSGNELTELAPSSPDAFASPKAKTLVELESLSRDAESIPALMSVLGHRLTFGAKAEELARYYFSEGRNIKLSSLGDKKVVSFVETVELKDGDVLALVTDGVMNPLTFRRTKDILQNTPQGVAQALIDAASAGEFPDRAQEDDRTAVVLRAAIPS